MVFCSVCRNKGDPNCALYEDEVRKGQCSESLCGREDKCRDGQELLH